MLGNDPREKRDSSLILVGVYYSVCFFEEFITGVGPLTRVGAAVGVVLAQ